jgi:hypothetical protein
MNAKSLAALSGILVVLLGILWTSGRFESLPAEGGGVGEGWLADAELESLSALEIRQGEASVRIELADGAWGVADRGGYPADLSRLRRLVQALSEMGSGQLADENPANAAAYGLADGGEVEPVEIALEHARGTSVLRLGESRRPRRQEDAWAPALGRYAQMDGGAIVLLKDDVPHADADDNLWWDRSLASVELDEVRRVEVSSGTASYALVRGEDGGYAMEGIAEGEAVVEGAARRVFGALRDLRADGIADEEEANAQEWGENADRYVAATKDAIYRAWIAPVDPEKDAGMRLVRLEVILKDEAGEEARMTHAHAMRKLEGRTFRIPLFAAEAMTMPRASLVMAAPPPAPPVEVEAQAAGAEAVPESSAAQQIDLPPVPEVPDGESGESARGGQT